MEWTTFGILAGLIVSAMGYLSRVIHRETDQVRSEMSTQMSVVRTDISVVRSEVVNLREAYMRHLEHHAAH
jgi:hypothetical protein